jgi:hypothetical protein
MGQTRKAGTPMLGTFAVDTGKTFTTALLMASQPKTRFGTSDQDTTSQGIPKWEAQVAVSFAAEFGMPAAADVIKVTIASPSDPASGIAPGTAVDLQDLRVGYTVAEKNEKGGIRGGRPYFGASGIRAARAAREHASAS